MLPQFASFRISVAAPTVAASGGGSTTVATNYTWFLQLQNRAGRNLLSAGVAATVNIGEQLQWTIPLSLPATGEEIFYYVLSASPSPGLEANAVLIAKVKARDDDQQTIRPLPIVVTLDRDEHFVLSGIVADTLSFPTGADLLTGMIRFATSTGKYYIYDDEALLSGSDILSYGVVRQGVAATPGYWIETDETFNSFVSDTQLSADLLLRDAQAALPSPRKGLTTPTIPVRVWLANGFAADGLSDIFAGSQYTIQVRIAEADVTQFFSGKIALTNAGRVDRSTGVLTTSNPGFGETTIWDGLENQIVLQSDLPRGEAEVFDIVLDFDNDELEIAISAATPQILLNIVDFSTSISKVSVIVGAIGDAVLSELSKMLVVPNKLLPGNAVITPRYVIERSFFQSLAGLLVSDTAGQYVTISSTLNGTVRVRQLLGDITDSERIRAIVSTEPGIQQLIASAPIALSGAENLEVTVSHPVNPTELTGTVRSNYPDPFLPGNTEGTWTVTRGFLWLVDSTTVYESAIQTVTATTTQVFNISDLAGFTVVGSLPTPPANRGPYQPDGVAVATTGVGTIPAETYTAYFAYTEVSPNNNITVIDHTSPPAIPTLTASLAEVISSALLKANNLSDVADLFTSQSNLQVGDILPFGTIALRDAYTAKLNDIAIVADGGDSLPRAFWWNGTAWQDFAYRAPYEPANIAARDALVDVIPGDIAKVADDGSGSPVDQIWNGSAWLNFIGAANLPFNIETSATAAATLDSVNLINGTTTLNLPAIVDGAQVVVADYTGSQFTGSPCTVVPNGVETIAGQPNYPLTVDGQAVWLYGEGSNWIVIATAGDVSGGTGSADLQSFVGATSSIADLASEDIAITCDRTIGLAVIETDVESTVRVYNSIAARTADNTRPLGTPAPADIEGLIAETQQVTGDLVTDLSPTLLCINRETTQTDDVYLKVFNQSGGNSVVTVTLRATILGGGGGSGDPAYFSTLYTGSAPLNLTPGVSANYVFVDPPIDPVSVTVLAAGADTKTFFVINNVDPGSGNDVDVTVPGLSTITLDGTISHVNIAYDGTTFRAWT